MSRSSTAKPRPAKLALALSGIVERRPADLKPWPDNPRRHSEKQLVALRASLRKFGFTNPVLTDEDGVILSGHGRVQAAIDVALAVIPTRLISGLTRPPSAPMSSPTTSSPSSRLGIPAFSRANWSC